jgi:hypothetical protein
VSSPSDVKRAEIARLGRRLIELGQKAEADAAATATATPNPGDQNPLPPQDRKAA